MIMMSMVIMVVMWVTRVLEEEVMFLVTVPSVTACSLCLMAGQSVCCPNRSLPSDLLQCQCSHHSVSVERWTRPDLSHWDNM